MSRPVGRPRPRSAMEAHRSWRPSRAQWYPGMPPSSATVIGHGDIAYSGGSFRQVPKAILAGDVKSPYWPRSQDLDAEAPPTSNRPDTAAAAASARQGHYDIDAAAYSLLLAAQHAPPPLPESSAGGLLSGRMPRSPSDSARVAHVLPVGPQLTSDGLKRFQVSITISQSRAMRPSSPKKYPRMSSSTREPVRGELAASPRAASMPLDAHTTHRTLGVPIARSSRSGECLVVDPNARAPMSDAGGGSGSAANGAAAIAAASAAHPPKLPSDIVPTPRCPQPHSPPDGCRLAPSAAASPRRVASARSSRRPHSPRRPRQPHSSREHAVPSRAYGESGLRVHPRPSMSIPHGEPHGLQHGVAHGVQHAARGIGGEQPAEATVASAPAPQAVASPRAVLIGAQRSSELSRAFGRPVSAFRPRPALRQNIFNPVAGVGIAPPGHLDEQGAPPPTSHRFVAAAAKPAPPPAAAPPRQIGSPWPMGSPGGMRHMDVPGNWDGPRNAAEWAEWERALSRLHSRAAGAPTCWSARPPIT